MSFAHSVSVDHRERQSQLALLLLDDSSWSVRFEHLTVGDYLIDGRWLIERKTLLDLAESIKDGRLFRQTIRMATLLRRQTQTRPSRTARPADSSALHVGREHQTTTASESDSGAEATRKFSGLVVAAALLIEGTVSELKHSGMTAQSIRAALATVSVFFGVPVLRTTCAAESAELLKSIAAQGRATVHAGLPRLGVRPKGKRRVQLHLLQGLPGIGPERATRLLDHFGTVKAVAGATEKELRAVAGVGPDCARRIVWALGEEVPPYPTDSQGAASPPAGACAKRER